MVWCADRCVFDTRGACVIGERRRQAPLIPALRRGRCPAEGGGDPEPMAVVSAVANQDQFAAGSAAGGGRVDVAARPGSSSGRWCFAGWPRCCGSASRGETSALAR